MATGSISALDNVAPINGNHAGVVVYMRRYSQYGILVPIPDHVRNNYVITPSSPQIPAVTTLTLSGTNMEYGSAIIFGISTSAMSTYSNDVALVSLAFTPK